MVDIQQEIQQLNWTRKPLGLYAPIGYALSSGGKRLRPTLCLLANAIFGGEDKAVVPVALALEIFHNFTLLHDDVMDQADYRRGRLCVHKKWNMNTAILSGDQMLIEAYRQLAQVQQDKLPILLDMFNQMATEVCEGQQYDIDFEQQDPITIDQYMLMIRLKTSVLLANALKMGAYIGGANSAEQNALYEFGVHLGLAFQIQDDYLDCYGDERTFGKAIGGDIREGKKTWLWLTAMYDERCAIDNLKSRDYTKVTEEYNRLGVPEKALQEINKLTLMALSFLDQVPQNQATGQLRALATKLLNRQV
ncbi:MAG: polyprenyl synthetase family protein [Paludibacteraceae bacterium]|nr:polyprenyl synthetase family protein [Paludibacteraceae bacterium]